MKNDDFYAIVMAGGRGERFWPQSRLSHPKQLLRLIGNLTLIEQTVARLLPLIKPENIIVITNNDYVAPMQSLLQIPAENIIGEPVGKDTAPCVALAAALIKEKSGNDNAVMIMLPADHVIHDTAAMLKVLEDGITVAAQGKIVTIGINPTYASTGYGYIHCGEKQDFGLATNFYGELGFKEKPNLKAAEIFLQEGCYKWNSGMFIWSVSTILNALSEHAPDLYEFSRKLCEAVKNRKFIDVLQKEYNKCRKISIDYAVMEKVDNVVVAECSFDWDDVGSWTALRNQIRPGENNNVVRGLYESIDSHDCIIVGDAKHLITTIDVKDLIIIHTEDATLVCNTKSAQRIKELVSQIGEKPELAKFL